MDPDAFRRASIAVVAGLTLLVAGIAFPIASAAEDAAITNTTDRGASKFAAVLKTQAARAGSPPMRVWQDDLADLPEPDPRAALVILGPSTPFTEREGESILRFLQAGGRVFIADDTGVANTLLEKLPTKTRIAGVELIDLAYSRQPHFPILYSITPHPLTEGVDTMVANAASALRFDRNATVIIASSDSSWLDADDDGLPGPGDTRGPHAVLTTEPIGRGELTVLADPSILTNEMIGVEGNPWFAENIGRVLAAGSAQIHVDETHRPNRPFAILASALPAASIEARAIVLVLAIAVPGGVLAGQAGSRRLAAWLEERRARREDPVETVLTRNPTWREHELRAVADRLQHPPRTQK